MTSLLSADGEISPFGITLGKVLDKKLKLKKLDKDKFNLTPPKKISLLETYAVFVNKKKVVIGISGVTKTYEDDAYCSKSKEDFEKLESMITMKYGVPSNTFNYLRDGAIYRESRDYMSSLAYNEREHSTYWESSKYVIRLSEHATLYGCYSRILFQDVELAKKYLENEAKAESDAL
jgi:hypothetical protein